MAARNTPDMLVSSAASSIDEEIISDSNEMSTVSTLSHNKA
eukprot:CAMPEP_0184981908 /NCGR_PEP_ID=MMETSP1098-20130426/11495_1 /TAXON_ID=89044 /ORGANISM="Spumella elongata, Strain CCAP 955/1" /LENGTH=40 /DNA_ID= /DNA_START= /DNA_END= /DNA_ORIENTATION=